ncbi:hypothetical protein LTS06_008786 [Exophiala xenobiotica]|nr:hypothetical protein LTS06_008786 [Exophiala xenobiotica]
MSRNAHSLGPTCAFYDEEDDDATTDGSNPPRVKAQFFYVSALPIDDPLSPLPPLSADRATDFPPKPFSMRDNAALEEAWQAFQHGGNGSVRDGGEDTKANLARGIISFPDFRDSSGSSIQRTNAPDQGKSGIRTGRAGKQKQAEGEVTLDQVPSDLTKDCKPVDAQELQDNPDPQGVVQDGSKHKRHFSPFRHRHKDGKASRDSSPKPVKIDEAQAAQSQSTAAFNSDISGRPFARAPSGRNISSAFNSTAVYAPSDESDVDSRDKSRSRSASRGRRKVKEQEKVFVPVGVSRLHLEDDKASKENTDNKYALKDITPDSLPSVRSLISDVMLDIPYYMSHHKDKMTSAVMREANRVYRLWCRNNPGFEDYGRVHLVAHSLGSVMAMEILSKQPTKLGKDMELDGKRPSEKFFEFDTTNLFCCGSPSGFFLLLNNASLMPRKGRNKPGMEGEDRQEGLASEARYGCLAVDNIYNICHRNDPISYLQNASVDQLYAASLQPASIPSASVGFMTRIGKSLRWGSSSASDAYTAAVPTSRPELQHLPSTVELDRHNFSREILAEKRMYLLNDNGQIDWFLNSGGGPLEIQYLNMLGAHSSYWILQDFVRFLVVEIGREPGKQHTLPALRAVKKREYKRGVIA